MKLQPVTFDSAEQQQTTASVPTSTMVNIGIFHIVLYISSGTAAHVNEYVTLLCHSLFVSLSSL